MLAGIIAGAVAYVVLDACLFQGALAPRLVAGSRSRGPLLRRAPGAKRRRPCGRQHGRPVSDRLLLGRGSAGLLQCILDGGLHAARRGAPPPRGRGDADVPQIRPRARDHGPDRRLLGPDPQRGEFVLQPDLPVLRTAGDQIGFRRAICSRPGAHHVYRVERFHEVHDDLASAPSLGLWADRPDPRLHHRLLHRPRLRGGSCPDRT